VTFGSSSYAGAIGRVRRELDMTVTVAILPISLYVVGFGVGYVPVAWCSFARLIPVLGLSSLRP